jgi:hypothetical protein
MIALRAALAAVEYALLAASKARICADPRGGRASFVALAFRRASSRRRTPDLRLYSSLRALWAPARRSRRRRCVRYPPIRRGPLPESVLFLVTERAPPTTAFDPSPEVPCFAEDRSLCLDRVPLRRSRSIASYTAISISALLTGLGTTRAEIAAAPGTFRFRPMRRVRRTRPRASRTGRRSSDRSSEHKDIRTDATRSP